MKLVGMFAAVALALAPVLASAQTNTTLEDDQAAATPEAGGVSQGGVLPIFAAGAIPTGAIIVGGIVVLGGVIIGVVAASDNSTSTTSTTN